MRRQQNVARARGVVPGTRVIRTIENPENSTAVALGRWRDPDEQVRAIAAAIDAAAAEAERA